jgi:hypothetical protein
MAGRKITQLPTLTTPAATDKLVIVDVSDTSESPQGTSKQIAVSNLGLTSIESSTLDVSIADGVATVDGISGTWTPVITNIANSSTIDSIQGFYSRVGNVVTMTFGITIEMDVAESTTTFDFSLPIASNFTSGNQLYGSCSVDSSLSILYAKSSASIGRVTIETTSAGAFIPDLQLMIQYQIIP